MSVQTSLTTPVHLCKIFYVPLHAGFPRKEEKKEFFFCVISNFCVLPVYFIKVLQNQINLMRYNWAMIGSGGLSLNLQFVKDFVKFLTFLQCGKRRYKGTI